MKTAIIAFEGVCVPDSPSKNIFELQPVSESLLLLTTLAKGYNLIAYIRPELPPQLVKQWLRQQGYPDIELMFMSSIEVVIEAARRRGYTVELVLSATPDVVALCVKMGVQAMLVVSPSYMRPEFRPDAVEAIRPWDQMVEQIDAVREQRNRDSRFEIVES